MRKWNLGWLLWLVLVLSLGANALLLSKQSRSQLSSVAIDERFVGSWLSRDPAGYRVLFLRSGEFVLTNYGTPYGPAGRWTVNDDTLTIIWAFDEEGEASGPQSTGFVFADDNAMLVFLDKRFGFNSFKCLVRAKDIP